MPEIEDIIETSEQAPILLGWQWALILLCVLIIGIAIRLLLKRKKRAISKPAEQLPLALQELSKLRETKLSDSALSTSISTLVRRFLQQKFQHKTLFQTQQEFVADHEDIEQLPPQARDHLIHYLNTLAEHKYSPTAQLPSSQSKLIEHTESLLRALNTIQPAGNPQQEDAT